MDIDYCLLAKEKMNKALENLGERFTSIRAGRANPNMLDNVNVLYYGTPTPVKQLATIFVPPKSIPNLYIFKNSLYFTVKMD